MEIFIGIVSGIVASWGMGGGALLISILSNFLHINQHVAQATNLIFFIPTALCSVFINIKSKNIKFKLAFQIISFGIIGTVLGSFFSYRLNKNILKKIFGVVLIIIAILEIYNLYKLYKKDKKMTQ